MTRKGGAGMVGARATRMTSILAGSNHNVRTGVRRSTGMTLSYLVHKLQLAINIKKLTK